MLYTESWNIQGKNMDCISHWLKACDPCIDVLALQEVGGIKNLQVAQCTEAHDGNSLLEFVFPDDELDDYYVYGTDIRVAFGTDDPYLQGCC